ncbi:transglutaminase-like domain-containing protein [Bacteroidota bacterium]|jgi:regulator of sirC expression with transglutaminase-like and TPR domain|nr:transglutaminase-like domain-containing protein [Balneolaceae bacterium]MDC0592345.1 transglutaminase-like domain-containing protein [Balneolaceae bacterium]MDC3136678.1 transglutaminase-like domain-containing protein [Bacteroidota bacterium]
MSTRAEIESLMFLLEDPDPFVQEQVQLRFMELGDRAVPLLDQIRVQTKDKEEKKRAKEVLHKLTFSTLKGDFAELLLEGIGNRAQLERAVITLARFGHPTLRESEYVKILDHFADMIRPSLRYKRSEREKMRILMKFIFEDLNFRGDNKDYHNPANGFIDQVIERRKGLPISLSLVAMFIARRLQLPVFGVNMPIHFMLAFVGEKEEQLIDPYDQGAEVSYDQCYFFLKKNNVTPKPEHFKMASDIDILARCIRNLMHSYERNEEHDRVQELKSLLGLVEGEAV